MRQLLKRWMLSPHPRSLRRELTRVRFWITVVALAVLSDYFSGWWVFRYAGLRHTERLVESRGAEPPRHVELLRIARSEVQRFLQGGSSSLNPRAVAHVLCAILKSRPRVVVIDLATSDPAFADPKHFSLPRTEVPLVFPYNLPLHLRGSVRLPCVATRDTRSGAGSGQSAVGAVERPKGTSRGDFG